MTDYRIFGNIDVEPQSYHQHIQDNLPSHYNDCAILSLNEGTHARNVVILRQNLKLFETNFPQHPLMCRFGNVYKTEDSLTNGSDMFKGDKNYDGAIFKELQECFKTFFEDDKRHMYDKFHNTYPEEEANNHLLRIKAIFPFFLALNYQHQWRINAKLVEFNPPLFKITYSDKSSFEIHDKFDPANVVAYIGCNKPYKQQLDDNYKNIDKRKNLVEDVAKTVWNVMHAIVREVIGSNRWRNSGIIHGYLQRSRAAPHHLNFGDIGSLIKLSRKRLVSLNANEIIDNFIRDKDGHINYITRLIELVIECDDEIPEKWTDGTNILRFKTIFHASEHIYRHYHEITPKIFLHVGIPPMLVQGPLIGFPMHFPENVPVDEEDMKKCIWLYLYEVIAQHKMGILSGNIDVTVKTQNGLPHITTLR